MPSSSATTPRAALRRLSARERQRQRDVLLRREDRHEVEGLEDEAELVTPQRGQPAIVEARELLHPLEAGADRVSLDAGGAYANPRAVTSEP